MLMAYGAARAKESKRQRMAPNGLESSLRLPKKFKVFPSNLEAFMRALSRTLLAGATSAVLALAAVPALARDGQPQVVVVQLPDGQVVQVQYTGTAAPVVMQPVIYAPAPADPAFAMLQRVAAMMDRQADAMLRQAAQFSAMTPGSLPPGAQFYSLSSSWSSNGGCTRSTEISYSGNGLKPRMVSYSSGDCGSGTAAPAYHMIPQHSPARLVEASANAPEQVAQLVR
jgi:hypothetical protein